LYGGDYGNSNAYRCEFSIPFMDGRTKSKLTLDRDIRNVPAVIGGNEENRHGIVLAKSILAKECGIKTGNSLLEARQKCPNLLVIPPDYRIYVRASKALKEYLMHILRVLKYSALTNVF